jgi:hypothetical protein
LATHPTRFAFGDYDGIAIVEGVDNIDTTAAALIVGASEAVKPKTTVLLTPDEVDKAVQKSGNYRPPGQVVAKKVPCTCEVRGTFLRVGPARFGENTFRSCDDPEARRWVANAPCRVSLSLQTEQAEQPGDNPGHNADRDGGDDSSREAVDFHTWNKAVADHQDNGCDDNVNNRA